MLITSGSGLINMIGNEESILGIIGSIFFLKEIKYDCSCSLVIVCKNKYRD